VREAGAGKRTDPLHTIKISSATTEQALAVADGLAAAGQYEMAARLYGWLAGRVETRAERIRLAVRHGLATRLNSRTPAMFELLKTLEAGQADIFVGEGLATWHKTLPFYEDDRFLELSEKHAHLLPLPNWHWNLNTALWAVQQVREVPGDLVELGVFKGHTTLFCAEYVHFADWPKRWFLYDTFEGVPEDQLDPGWEQANRDVYGGTFSYDEVKARFAHIANIQVIKGRVPEVLHEGAPEQISFLHVDLNNTSAEIGALDLLFDRVSPGGIILFDDFGWASARRQHLAEKAWFAERGLQILALPTGQGVFVKT
jgi:O-methyltransferase